MLRNLCSALFVLAIAQLATAQPDPGEDGAFQTRLRMSRHATESDVEFAQARVQLYEQGLNANSDSLLLLTPLANLGRSHETLGHWGPAIENYDRARAIGERHMEATDLRLAWAFRDLANVLRIVNAAQPSQEFFARSLEIQQSHVPADDSELAETLRQRVRLWLNASDLEKAAADADRALGIAASTENAPPGLLPACMQARARVHDTRGEFAKAYDLFTRGEELMRSQVAADHVGLADLLNDFSRHLQTRGDLRHAKQLLDEASTILLEKFPPDHVYNGVIQTNLAELNSKEGDFAAALRILEGQLKLTEEAFGATHPRVAGILNNMAGNRLLLGEIGDAVALYEQSLKIYGEAYGESHELVGRGHSNLAAAYQELGRFDAAEQELRQATEVIGATAGYESFLYLHSLTSLGELQLEAGRAADAEATLVGCVETIHKVLGAQHPLLAEGLLNLGGAKLIAGDRASARGLWGEALVAATAQGEEHPLRADVAMRLAELELNDDPAAALGYATLAETVSGEHLRLLSRGASQNDALRYAGRRARGLPAVMAAARRLRTPEAIGAAWDVLIRSRAIVFDELAERALISRRSEDPAMEARRETLRTARARLARLAADPSERLSDDERVTLLGAAEVELRYAEEGLAKLSDRFRARSATQRAGAIEVIQRLPANSLLLSYLRYELDGDTRYVAFVRTAGELRLVDLGAAAAIDEAVQEWRREVTSGSLPPGPLAHMQMENYFLAGSALRELVWDPLEIPATPERIYIVPDGRLHQVSFGALPMSAAGFLLENGAALHYLGAERDLLAEFQSGGRGLLAVGGPDFGAVDETRAPDDDCRQMRDLSFRALPSSEAEIFRLGEMFSAGSHGPLTTLVGLDASESRFASAAPAYSILHVATHGFFLGGDCAPTQSPLLRSGLAFSNANLRGESNAIDDGILSGEEILSLELDSVDWVVLSACDTGVGDDVEGAGLLGLRRAFRWSGANTLVSSLWAVEDEATQELMLELYRNRLSKGASSTEALRQAQLTFLRQRREDGRSEHPFSWAAFVASGDWH